MAGTDVDVTSSHEVLDELPVNLFGASMPVPSVLAPHEAQQLPLIGSDAGADGHALQHGAFVSSVLMRGWGVAWCPCPLCRDRGNAMLERTIPTCSMLLCPAVRRMSKINV